MLKLNFSLHEPAGWTETVAEFEQVRRDDGRAITLKGVCPCCRHAMSVDLAIEERTGERVNDKPDNQDLDSRSFVKIAFCNCTEEHPERPQGKEGCGAFGALLIGEKDTQTKKEDPR